MARLILQNKSSMDIYVPTPSGAGRVVPPGKCVEGSFYRSMVSGLKHMMLVPEGSVPEASIICKYNSITQNVMDTSEGIVASTPAAAPVKPMATPPNAGQTNTPPLVPAPVVPVETPSVIDESVEPVEPVEPVEAPIPVVDGKLKSKDLNKLNLTELKLAASGLGIEYDDTTTKRQLVNLLVAKDFKG